MIYNLFHPKLLCHNVPLYKKWGVDKKYYSPVGYQDFKNLGVAEKPWLDVINSREALPGNLAFESLSTQIQEELLPWSDNGYAVLKKYFNDDEVALMLHETDALVKLGKANWRYNNSKIMFAVLQSSTLRKTASSPQLEEILSLLLGKKVRLFQSINFYKGSQQAAHSDTIHMTTFPLGFMIAVWIALEDISAESGPLSYFPGSHQLPYVLNKEIDNEGNTWLVGDKSYTVYENELGKRLEKSQLEKKIFLAKKGDVLIWHANLIHGGEPITVPNSTRKSMVMHYFAEDVIAFHEYTQRPALIHQFD